jgi:hypothetical protein
VPSPIAQIKRIHPKVLVVCLLAVWMCAPVLVSATATHASLKKSHARADVVKRSALTSTNSPVVADIDSHIAEAQRKLDIWKRRIKLRTRHITKVSEQTAQIASASKTSVTRMHKRLKHAIALHLQAWNQMQRYRAYIKRMQAARAKVLAALAGGGVSGIPGGRVTYGLWARTFLSSLGAPPCADNIQVIVSWETAESTLASFNPLATTFYMPGAVRGPKSNIENYVSFGQGIQAARDTVLKSPARWGYAPIVDDLIQCAPAGVTATAVHDSLWCSGCTNGAYVVGRLSTVRGDLSDHEDRMVGGG